jgi:hypothetical protein
MPGRQEVGRAMAEWFRAWGTKEGVILICLVYSIISLAVFWIIAYVQSGSTKKAKDIVEQAKSSRQFTDNPGAVLADAAKLVDAFTKAGPAIASLGASIAALGFAAYIVAQQPKDEDKTKTGEQPASQGTTPPATQTK